MESFDDLTIPFDGLIPFDGESPTPTPSIVQTSFGRFRRKKKDNRKEDAEAVASWLLFGSGQMGKTE